MTVEEYLVFESKSKIRHEYSDGEIISMAGAKRNHSLAAGNIFRHLANQLAEKDCEVHQNDIKVRVRENRFVYPDIIVACGELQWESNETVLLNPTVIFEVLSNSTETRDRGEKAQDYRQLSHLADYLLVSQKEILIEHYIRQNDGSWKLLEYRNAEERISLQSIGCILLVKDIYAKVKFSHLKLIRSKDKNGKRRS